MNNYHEFKNYNYSNMYNNKMNSYNTNTKQNKNNYNNYNNFNNELYDPYNGFIRGNLFKNEYDPYKKNEPYDVKPMNEQAELLTSIDALGFAMTDLNLYLDIYENDRNAINLYNQYKLDKANLTKEYESKYGPITLNSEALASYPWAWDDMPWPWDN